MQHILPVTRNLLVTICYDGNYYHGWQIQQNALTVQEVFQNALENVISERPNIKGCSRTDSGVHANCYCISFLTNHTIPPQRLRIALNRFLPKSIAVIDCRDVELDFHARYSCKSKQYIYKIWNSENRSPFWEGYAYHYRYKIDEELLNKSAQSFVGKHNFTSFCTVDNREKGDLTRTIYSISVKRSDEMVTVTIEGDGFLYNMVRIIVGTLLKVQQGKIAPDAIIDIINAMDRKYAGPTAPACGLYLNKVCY